MSWLSTEILWLSASVDLLSSLDMYLPEFLVLLACVCILCHGVHQQTNRHSGDEKNSTTTKARTHTHVQAHMQRSLAQPSAAVVTSVMLIRSRSSHTYIHRHTSMHVCLCGFLSIPDTLSLRIQSYIPTCIPVCLFMYKFVIFLPSEHTLQLAD